MKIKRYKKMRKLFDYYKYNHNLVPPYRVVVDGAFLQAALDEKVMVAEQMPKVCQVRLALQWTCFIYSAYEYAILFVVE
jgi:hypothetical protein